jgi:hypothetical protein
MVRRMAFRKGAIGYDLALFLSYSSGDACLVRYGLCLLTCVFSWGEKLFCVKCVYWVEFSRCDCTKKNLSPASTPGSSAGQ